MPSRYAGTENALSLKATTRKDFHPDYLSRRLRWNGRDPRDLRGSYIERQLSLSCRFGSRQAQVDWAPCGIIDRDGRYAWR